MDHKVVELGNLKSVSEANSPEARLFPHTPDVRQLAGPLRPRDTDRGGTVHGHSTGPGLVHPDS